MWERFKAASKSLLHCIEWTYSNAYTPPVTQNDLSYRNWEPHLALPVEKGDQRVP